ncbi:MAG: decaprenyl-phosphate phosphoribosyltransferase [Candidatus Omnitrophica bacterium]|nr:decaprenyl-phosphate phosphoribosyltransferase [Candidatus Omnitrophota bacterium]MBU4334801.1 decaprenyl-phosphate phosphoribosyltransferase [Candidatus Omnitrophota bacterium]
MKHMFIAIRPKHWIKNMFIFLPLIFGKKLFISPLNTNTVLAFFLFSIAASAVYLMNDIIDCEKDKKHPAKKLRPIASGKISTNTAIITSILLGSIAIAGASFLSINFCSIIIIYLIANIIYSKILKEAVIIDVFCIAVFFFLRVLAGGIVAETEISHWLIIMTALIALFLGLNKRRQELLITDQNPQDRRVVLDKYSTYFIDQMIAVITSSVVISYMLYTVDERTVSVFGTKNLIYSVPFVYYGIFRYLYLIHKANADGDPTKLFLSDYKMQLNVILWLIVCAIVIYF